MRKIDKVIRNLRKESGESKILIGDIRDEMARDMYRMMESVINMKQDLKEYYILVYARARGKEISERMVILKDLPQYFGHEPVKMLGTMCWHVNNAKGTIDRLWVLPRDIPIPDEFMVEGKTIPEIAKAVEGIPLNG